MSYYNKDNIKPTYNINQISSSQRQNFNINNITYKSNTEEYHDIIYYKENGITSHEIKNISYENVIDFPIIAEGTNSHHLGVMGVYKLKRVKPEKI
jgi:hypothetical protein